MMASPERRVMSQERVGKAGGDVAPTVSISEMLARQARERPDKVMLVFDDQSATFAEAQRRAAVVAGSLRASGLVPGDRVAIYMANCIQYADAWLGAIHAGVNPVPINLAYRGDFLLYQLRDSAARIVVTSPELLPEVAGVAAGCPQLQLLVVVGDAERSGDAPATTWSEFVDHEPVPAEVSSPSDPAALLYTSGTTGPSKGVLLSHEYLLTMGAAVASGFGVSEPDVSYFPMPMFHVSGLSGILFPLIHGSTGVVDARFHPTEFWRRVAEVGATTCSVVGPMLQMLWNQPAGSMERKTVMRVIGLAPIPVPIPEIVRRYGLEGVATMYGLTEAFPVAIGSYRDPLPDGAAGRPNPAFEMRIVSDEGREAAVGEVGEIRCRARSAGAMFSSYLGAPEITESAFADGWFLTGDLGRLDAEGFLYFIDRKKDALRRRGENISSSELESALRSHPAVADVAVIPHPSELGEDDVKACLVLEPGIEIDFAELDAYFSERVPAFCVPRYLEILAELPRNPTGRVQKFKLRAAGNSPATWDRERQ
jgi:crotonobetaine/carnitine-CoA ligase